MRLLFICCLLVSMIKFLGANVTSNQGKIEFDVNGDGSPEATLNNTGFGIGMNLVPAANLHVLGDTRVTGSMGVGTSSQGGSTLSVKGAMSINPLTASADTDLTDHSLVLADSQSGNITLALPAYSTVVGRVVTIKKIYAGNTVTIQGTIASYQRDDSFVGKHGLRYPVGDVQQLGDPLQCTWLLDQHRLFVDS